MPAPPELHRLIADDLAKMLAPLIDRAWDAGADDVRARVQASVGVPVAPPTAAKDSPFGPPAPRLSPQKRGAINRHERGRVKKIVGMLIADSPDGITRQQIRTRAGFAEGGSFILKEGSLKQALRLLRIGGKIENRGNKWFPK